MQPTILIISSEADTHIPFVTRHLPPESTVVVDPSTFAKGNVLTYTVTDDSVSVEYAGVSLDTIRSVWYRKPELTPKDQLPVAEGFKDYSYSGLRQHFLWLVEQFDDAFWISDYYRMQKAGDKMAQLVTARKLGFAVPQTIATSDPQQAKAFLKAHEHTIIKPLSRHGFMAHKQGVEHSMFFFATKVSSTDTVDVSNLELAPCFFQEAVGNIVADIRVNVVGDKVFATAITNPGLQTDLRTRDWRVGHQTGTLAYAIHDLPPDIAQRCVQYIRAFGLQFGALDLIIDTAGTYWFLENNPNGQWAFIEEETNQPIGKAIADLLLATK